VRASLVRVLVLILFVAALPTEAVTRITVKELFYILKRDGISNSLEPETRVSSIGRILLNGRWFSFFLYDHFMPATKHGLRRILLLDDKKRYLGGYMVEEVGNCKFGRSRLMCEDENGKLQLALDFSGGHLPLKTVIGGYDTVLEK
jgi:hypothetical protein